MLGTIVNTACILLGSTVGSLLKKGLGDKYRDVLYFAMGLASMALGISTFTQNLPKSEFPVLFILSLAVGGVAGTALDLDGRAKAAISRRGGEGLANGLISASLLFCVGTFSIVGPIMSATTGDNTLIKSGLGGCDRIIDAIFLFVDFGLSGTADLDDSDVTIE